MVGRETPRSQIISRAPLEVTLLKRAESDLAALSPEDRAVVAGQIDVLSRDALPRGVAAIHGQHGGHLRVRVGRFRVLYRLRDGAVVVVAITTT